MEQNQRKRGDSVNLVSPQSKQRNKRSKNVKENEPSDQQLPLPLPARTKYSFTSRRETLLKPLQPLKIENSIPSDAPNKPHFFSPKKESDGNVLGSDDQIIWEPTPRQLKIRHLQTQTNENENESHAPINFHNNVPSSPLSVFKTNPMKDITGDFAISFDNLGESQKSPTLTRKTTPTININLPTPKLNIDISKLIPPNSPFSTPKESKKTVKKRDISGLMNSVVSSFGSSSKDQRSNSLNNSNYETPIKLPTIKSNSMPLSAAISTPDIPRLRKEKPMSKEDESDDSMFSDDTEFLDLLSKSKTENPQNSQTVKYLSIKVADSELIPSLSSGSSKNSTPKDAVTKATIPPSVKKEEEVKPRLETTQPIKKEQAVESDDDFSDDDDFLEILERKLTQVPAIARNSIQQKIKVEINTQSQSQSQSRNYTVALDTQQINIRDADSKGHMVFKKDIDDSQAEAFQFKEEEINKAKSAVVREHVERFEILNILNAFYHKNNMKKSQKIIAVRDRDSKETKIIVRGFWATLEFEIGDVLHVIGRNFKIIDDETDNLLIWNPDILLSATLVSDTINCTRRSVLKQRVDFNGEYSVPLIVGEVIHHVFQGVLAKGECTMNLMTALMNEAIAEHHLTILIIQQLESEVRNLCAGHLPYIKTWFDSYNKPTPDQRSILKVSNTNKKIQFSCSNILDVEENIISHIYGLRGFIDVTIEAHIKTLTEDTKLVVPLELKSGGYAQTAHEAQASFYTLMMRDRYEMNVEFFMLVYSKLAQTTMNQVSPRQIKELVILRNKLSQFMRDGTRVLPPPIKQDQCNRCYATTECMTYYNLMEDGKEEDLVLPSGMFTELTGHLNQRHRDFFNYWDDLITKEDAVSKIVSKELFLIDSETREKSGKCIGHLVIDSIKEEGTPPKEQEKFLYTFKRARGKFGPISATQLVKNDKVQISDENGSFGLATGWVVAITKDVVQISTNKRLTSLRIKLKNFDAKNNQTFQTHLKPIAPTQQVVDSREVQYRIDKDEMFAGMRTARTNVLNLFLREGDAERRRLIVNEEPPKYSKETLPYRVLANKFNKDQMAAFEKVLSAEDYALILGMPGTGKTTVIAQLIKFLVENGKTVLLSSYTHSAVDNILIKIQNEDIGILRLGSSLSRIHPEIQRFSPLTKEVKTGADLDEVYFKPPVVATTCLSINDWIFNRRRFDYCIVDESSQVSMPVCLGPLKFCEKFVLVGDHYQLPPLVQNHKAKGLSKSLFKMLSEKFPESVVDLTYQYRMCEDIMLLTNTIIYEGRLKCGSPEVANQSLAIPSLSNLSSHLISQSSPRSQRWLDLVLDEKRKVLFLNHDEVGDCQETKFKENIENLKEAELIRQMVEALLSCGVAEESIGIMSFYRAQLRRLNRVLINHPNIEKLTADQFQGRDKDCIIISLVKSNDMNDAGSLLREWRRVNVAITRAKSKLIIIGSKKTLNSLETIGAFINILESRGWSYNLPFQADKIYQFGEADATQLAIDSTLNKSVKEMKIVDKRTLVREIVEEAGI